MANGVITDCTAGENGGYGIDIEGNTVTENIAGIVVESQLYLITRNGASHNGDLDPVSGGFIVNYDVAPGNTFVPAPFRLSDEDVNPLANMAF